MTAFEIPELGVFMPKLLKTSLFDPFLLVEATVRTSVTWQVDGRLHLEFFSEQEREEKRLQDCPCTPFSLVRETVFSMMKGKNLPLSFQFVFLLAPENTGKLLAEAGLGSAADAVSGLHLNLNYRNGKLTATTGVSYRTFTRDKAAEQEWDAAVEKFFRTNHIAAESIL